MNNRLRLLAAAVLAAGVVLAACGGDDDGDTSTPAAPGGSGNTATAAAPLPASTRPASPAPTQASAGSGSAREEFINAAREARSAKFTATYTIASSEMKGTMTFAQDGEKFAFKMDASGAVIAVINAEGATYTCFGAGTTGTCTRGEPDPSLTSFDPAAALEGVDQAGTVERAGDRTVGGYASACWKSAGTSGELTICIARKEKVLTLVEGAGAKMELQDYSGSVDSKLFEPPYPVQ
ncbi:hypothetical protein [Tepidiforma sp.]|uniref:hypothetical protein n=1 Tax=Tepidiforma sp. TaxID=2682230 RepID=UPI002ADD59D0|nr:hypothetical protein [Tepidiforma sp.]